MRCQSCGRKLPCQPCHERHLSDVQESLLDALDEAQEPPKEILVWFNMPLDLARQALNRLMGEWRGTIEVIEPELAEDQLGCILNRDGKGYPIELEITPTRVMKVDHTWLQLLLSVA